MTPASIATMGSAGRFTSKERDAETGLDFFGARYMSSAQGRFTSVDPQNAGASLYNPQSWNAYSYTLNNPLIYVDPDGDVAVPAAIVGAVVGAVVGGGFELGRQLLAGKNLNSVELARVGTAAAGGAISGAITGGTLGIGAAAGLGVSSFEFAATNAAANVVGGVGQRQLNSQFVDQPGTSTTLSDELVNVASDAVFGVVGAKAGGQYADSVIPLSAVRREIETAKVAGRRSLRALRQAVAQDNFESSYLRNSAVGGVVGGVHSAVSSWWVQTFWSAQQRKEPKACVETIDSASGSRSKECH